MKLCCISLFLDPRLIEEFSTRISELGLSSYFRREVVSDQTGFSAPSIQGRIGEVSLILFPCNSFHKHRDFEIGLTEATLEEWNQRIGSLLDTGVVSEAGDMNDADHSQYAIFGGPSTHGPFFGLYDGQCDSLVEGDVLSAELPPKEYRFYLDSIMPTIDESLRRGLRIDPSDSDSPRMSEIRIANIVGRENQLPHASSLQFRFADDRIYIWNNEIDA